MGRWFKPSRGSEPHFSDKAGIPLRVPAFCLFFPLFFFRIFPHGNICFTGYTVQFSGCPFRAALTRKTPFPPKNGTLTPQPSFSSVQAPPEHKNRLVKDTFPPRFSVSAVPPARYSGIRHCRIPGNPHMFPPHTPPFPRLSVRGLTVRDKTKLCLHIPRLSAKNLRVRYRASQNRVFHTDGSPRYLTVRQR